jgi:glycosyltransferase involved in cell wall biosynthesis
MRVAFVSQFPLALDAGGLEVQLLSTADALRSTGVEVELFDPWKPHFDADLLHCFGSDYQLGEIVSRSRARHIPVVVSAVFAPHRSAALYVAWKQVDKLLPLKTSFGVRAEILHMANAVIALTGTEADYLNRFFGADSRKIRVIPNGVDERFLRATPEVFAGEYGVTDFVLCVASVEPLKNQVRLAQATAGTGLPLVLIGAPRSREMGYRDLLVKELNQRTDVVWIQGLPHDDPLLPSAYSCARIHVLPSLVEAQGISTLEAAAAGANVIVSDLPALREAFGASAWYCNPRSVVSIRKAIGEASRAFRGARYDGRPSWLCSWSDVARRLLQVYEDVLAARL